MKPYFSLLLCLSLALPSYSQSVKPLGNNGGGGGGGASDASQLVTCAVTMTSTTVLTIGASSSATTPCKASFGNLVYAITSPVTETISGSATGTAYFSIDSSGSVDGAVGSAAVACAGWTCSNTSSSTVPDRDSAIILWSWPYTTGTWNATGAVDLRAVYSTNPFACGAGLTCATTQSLTTASLDTAFTSNQSCTFAATATGCQSPSTSINVSALGATSNDQFVVQCFTGAGTTQTPVALLTYVYTASAGVIQTVAPSFASAAAAGYCTVNGSGAGGAGPSGSTGPTGPQGTAGPTGATGSTGATGTAGTNGSTGATGATGATGSANAAGSTVGQVQTTNGSGTFVAGVATDTGGVFNFNTDVPKLPASLNSIPVLGTDSTGHFASETLTGSGSIVAAVGPVLSAPTLGTPASVNLVNAADVPISPNVQTGSYALAASDWGREVIMQCTASCTVTLYGTPPAKYWARIVSTGSTVATVSLNGLNYNGSSSVPVLISYLPIDFTSDGSNYFGNAPLVAGSGVTFSPASNGVTVAATSGGGGTVTSVATTGPITGGTITGAGTIACATCATAAAGGSLTTSGAFAGTLTFTGATNVTFPTSGTLSTTTGTVTSVATTGPITGGTITGTGTIACATCVTASSPGAGIAHFAGSTQAATSSLIVAADITSNTITGSQLASSLALVTPSLGAATATSLLATGIVDGTAPMTITTGTTANLGSTYNSGYTFNQEGTAGTGVTYTLPATAVGKQYCVFNSGTTGVVNTGALTVYPASGSYVILNGVVNTVGGGGTHGVASGGAAGDGACFLAIDATHWQVSVTNGTWTEN